ncbi:MAG: TRAM domain-containing protein [Nanopusillaceae archaeon]
MSVRGIRVGEVYQVEIRSLTQRGDGFTRIKGVATFVKNVTPGWKGKVKIIKVGSTYVVAEPFHEEAISSEQINNSSEDNL